MVDTLGQAGQLAGQFGQIKRHQDLEAKQAEAEQERINAKAEVFDRGTAAQQVLEQAPIWQEQIATKKLPVPTNPDDIPAWAAQFAEAHVDPNAPPAQRDEYLKRAKAHLTSFAARQALIDSNQAMENLAESAKNAALGTLDGAVLNKSASALVDLGFTEQDAAARVGLPALNYAANSGNQAAFDTAQAFLGDRFKDKQQEAEKQLAATKMREQNNASNQAEAALWQQVNDGLPYETILSTADQMRGALGDERLAVFKRNLSANGQARTFADLQKRILLGQVTPESVQEELILGIQKSPDAPDYISPGHAEAILTSMVGKQRDDLSDQRVHSRLLGAPVNLTPEDDSALARAFGPATTQNPYGLGIIGADNRITNPSALGTQIARAGRFPSQTQDVVIANLTSTNAADVSAAAVVVGMVGAADGSLWAQLHDHASESVRPMLDKARDLYATGQMQTPEQVSAAASIIKTHAATTLEIPKEDPVVVRELQRNFPTKPGEPDHVSTVINDAVVAVGKDTPAANKTLLGIDWLRANMTAQSADENLAMQARRWYEDRFTELRGLPNAMRDAKASEYVSAKIKSSVDYPVWNGAMIPVLIDTGNGFRLPQNYRWAADSEAEAKRFLQSHGIDPADVVAVRPHLQAESGGAPPMPNLDNIADSAERGRLFKAWVENPRHIENPVMRTGWEFVPLADPGSAVFHNGRKLVWRPSHEAQQSNADFYAEKAAANSAYREFRMREWQERYRGSSLGRGAFDN